MTAGPRAARILVAVEDEKHAGNYLAALDAAGIAAGEIAVLLPGFAPAAAERLAAGADGVLLCGGPDLDPRHYGEEILPDSGVEVDAALDALDLALLAGARTGAIPVLAICRGLQVLNVFCGGSLWQDLPSQLGGEDPVEHYRRQPADALPHVVTPIGAPGGGGSGGPERRLREVIGSGELAVNSRHHQGIRRLGRGLAPVASSPDGVVEAVAGTGAEWWTQAVQWHPENLLALAPHRQLFLDFAAAAAPARTGPHR